MRIGLCVNMLASPEDPVGARWISPAAKAGYDYLELPVDRIMALSEEEFSHLRGQVERSDISCECCNACFQAHVRLTGDRVDKALVEDYLRASMARAKALGAKLLCFGGASAKNVPEGFSYAIAEEQIAEMLLRAAEYCEKLDLQMLIEPLNRSEANITTTLAQAEKLMRRVDSPRIRLVADYYHFALEHDSMQDLRRLVPDVLHTHFAEPVNRAFPTGSRPEYMPFFESLRNGGYRGRCSLEACSADPMADIVSGLAALRAIVSE